MHKSISPLNTLRFKDCERIVARPSVNAEVLLLVTAGVLLLVTVGVLPLVTAGVLPMVTAGIVPLVAAGMLPLSKNTAATGSSPLASIV